MNESINITKLCNLLKECLPGNKYKVTGEVSQPKLSQGHLYLTLKDNTSTIKAIIWKTKYDKIIKIKEGDKITVYGKLDYYNLIGTISLIIDSVLTNEGIGELQQNSDILTEIYKDKGYFNKETKLPIPLIIKKIIIITSITGAAIHDFLFNLQNNKSKIIYEIIDVPVQGIESPKIIASKLENIDIKDYDLIIITRGGGSLHDLIGFSDPILIEAVNAFNKIPIISAIGHQIDNPLLDLVADFSCPTPSLAAQYLVDINKKYLDNLYNIKNELKEDIMGQLRFKNNELAIINNKLNNSFTEINNMLTVFHNNIITELENKQIKLDYLLKSLDNPNIELYNLDFIKISEQHNIIKDNILIMRWNNQDFKIQIL